MGLSSESAKAGMPKASVMRQGSSLVDVSRLAQPIMIVGIQGALSQKQLEEVCARYSAGAEGAGCKLIVHDGRTKIKVVQPASQINDLIKVMTRVAESNEALVKVLMDQEAVDCDPDVQPLRYMNGELIR